MNKKLQKLLRFNKIMAGLHAVQGVAILLLASDFSLPVTTSYQVYNQASEQLEAASRQLFSVRLAYLVVAFFLMSSFAHFYLSFMRPKWYVSRLRKGINKARWVEYAFSASTMIVAIAMLAGIENLGTLLALFGLTAVMNLMGLVMEIHNKPVNKLRPATDWLSYKIGVLAGAIPWVVIAIVFWGSETSGQGNIPTFVYYIYGSIFVVFNVFALNMVAQYKRWGKWSDYLYGERAYIILSLIAKSALGWQIFFGTLRPV